MSDERRQDEPQVIRSGDYLIRHFTTSTDEVLSASRTLIEKSDALIAASDQLIAYTKQNVRDIRDACEHARQLLLRRSACRKFD
jgi:hypothetical protein